jgi:NAD(P)-dependent dehydrogenase (short-subunit alcohol dehydrogenase family)
MPSYPSVQPEIGYSFCTRHNDTYPEINPATQSNCSGLSVLITGSSKGIGQATAISFALAGASQLALAARTDLSPTVSKIEAKCKELGKPVPKILTLKVDVADYSSVEAAAAQVEKEFGRLDILHNNAGAADAFLPVLDSDPVRWWRLNEINVLGVYHSTRAFLPLLLKGGLKTIVNVASIGAHSLSPGGSSYQVGKLAIVKFSEYVMVDYADQGVVCFSIHPGGVRTDMANHVTPEFADAFLNDTPELAADALVYLTQTKKDWLAGRYVDLCWDMPEFIAREKEIVEGDKLKIKLQV